MQLAVLYIASVVIFLALDVIGLRYLIKPAFERELGDWLLDNPRYGPALVFYLFYVAGLLYFVSVPALAEDWSVVQLFLSAAFFGAIAYGTYEFSNLATLERWSWSMVVTDLTWGTILTAISGTLGVAVARWLG